MREKMKEMDIRITELCDYLHFSRPTMYRFIDNYEAGKYRGIDRGVLSLFRYIDETPNIGKKNVISFILTNNMVQDNQDDESKLSKSVKKYEGGKFASEEKTGLLIKLMSSSDYDHVVHYLSECEQIRSKDSLTPEDYEKIGRLALFRYDVENNTKLTKTQIKKVESITGVKL